MLKQTFLLQPVDRSRLPRERDEQAERERGARGGQRAHEELKEVSSGSPSESPAGSGSWLSDAPVGSLAFDPKV